MLTMNDMLKKENVFIKESVTDWKDAIHVAVQPLVDQGYCEARYIDGVIQNTLEMGPYYVLMPELALIHARPEQGAIETQLCVTVLKQPIRFKEDGFDVRILITLVGKDSESHLVAMQAVATIFGDPEGIQKVLDATSTEDIYNMFMAAAGE